MAPQALYGIATCVQLFFATPTTKGHSIQNRMSYKNPLTTSSFLAVNRTLARTLGLHEAILLAEFITKEAYHTKRHELTHDGYFYHTRTAIQHNTTLSSFQQRKAVDSLVQHSALLTTTRGIPKQTYYKLNHATIESFVTSSSKEAAPLEAKKLHDKTTTHSTPSRAVIRPLIKENKNKAEESNNNTIDNDRVDCGKRVSLDTATKLYTGTESIAAITKSYVKRTRVENAPTCEAEIMSRARYISDKLTGGADWARSRNFYVLCASRLGSMCDSLIGLSLDDGVQRPEKYFSTLAKKALEQRK